MVILGYIIQVLCTIGVLYSFGLLMYYLNKNTLKNLGKRALKFYKATGVVGTPVHELSHAFFCPIFMHKIVEIKLFQPSSTDGTLGYVAHTYNKKNVWSQIGNFFIGIGPLIIGSTIIVLLMWLATGTKFTDYIKGVTSINSINDFFNVIIELFKLLFHPRNFKNVFWYLFIIISFLICMHMNLSTPDVKHSFIGLGFILAILFIVDVIVILISKTAFDTMTMSFIKAGVFLVSILFTAIILDLIVFLITFIFKKRK